MIKRRLQVGDIILLFFDKTVYHAPFPINESSVHATVSMWQIQFVTSIVFNCTECAGLCLLFHK